MPTSYLVMGLIYITVSGVANIMFKNLGMDNTKAAFWSSLFILPYTIKPLWAPEIELYKTKKFFVLLMQFILVGAVVAAALSLRLECPLPQDARPRSATVPPPCIDSNPVAAWR